MQQPGSDRDERDNTDDGQQQVAEVNRLKVRFRTVVLHPTLAEREVHHGDQHTDNAQRERGAPAVMRGQPRRCQH
ncbi:hypothetical protein SDC9_206463 [bioreactor metagenome]|uniref:Uncharacterized protein n=1 Tax=bioreactor metagenome TaxID=1076179 RepID=A0A645J6J0_9ZZZZ